MLVFFFLAIGLTAEDHITMEIPHGTGCHGVGLGICRSELAGGYAVGHGDDTPLQATPASGLWKEPVANDLGLAQGGVQRDMVVIVAKAIVETLLLVGRPCSNTGSNIRPQNSDILASGNEIEYSRMFELTITYV